MTAAVWQLTSLWKAQQLLLRHRNFSYPLLARFQIRAWTRHLPEKIKSRLSNALADIFKSLVCRAEVINNYEGRTSCTLGTSLTKLENLQVYLISVISDEVPICASTWNFILAGVHHHLDAALLKFNRIISHKCYQSPSNVICFMWWAEFGFTW